MVLFVDACARAESRTRALAEYLLEKLGGATETVSLYTAPAAPLDAAGIEVRNAAGRTGDFSAPLFGNAKQFAAADTIVMAAPFWDLSFPSVLKAYLESVCVTGLTFRYNEQGIPVGMCRGQKLYYVSTSGGPTFGDPFGFGYVNTLATRMLGIGECVSVRAENLDIVGSDPAQLLREAFSAVDALL